MAKGLSVSAVPVIPVRYGALAAGAWPPGSYWVIEYIRSNGVTLFWADLYDALGRTGWTYSAQMAAGFATKDDALTAYEQRGETIDMDHGVVVDAFEHIWSW